MTTPAANHDRLRRARERSDAARLGIIELLSPARTPAPAFAAAWGAHSAHLECWGWPLDDASDQSVALAEAHADLTEHLAERAKFNHAQWRKAEDARRRREES